MGDEKQVRLSIENTEDGKLAIKLVGLDVGDLIELMGEATRKVNSTIEEIIDNLNERLGGGESNRDEQDSNKITEDKISDVISKRDAIEIVKLGDKTYPVMKKFSQITRDVVTKFTKAINAVGKVNTITLRDGTTATWKLTETGKLLVGDFNGQLVEWEYAGLPVQFKLFGCIDVVCNKRSLDDFSL